MSAPERSETPETAPRPVEIRRRRRSRTSRRRSSGKSRHRLRAAYFCLASLWGFVTGTGAVLLGLGAAGQNSSLNFGGRVLIAVAALVAVLGGTIAASAYRATTRRGS